MENFTPFSGLIGGLMIGLSATLLILVNGRIAGISGIFGGLLSASGRELPWRLAFVVGLVIGPLLVGLAQGAVPAVDIQGRWPMLIAGGLLVGFGSRLGSGCTSGHGVCGLARGSARSFAATATFFGVAIVTVYVVRHLVGG
ncbi:MAG TPA: YeeE/YedE family protein [Alphaproteobacteria bacterium]|nr:YeeE/YedE family protein [Alphaproteobacteria bacterium]